jgi:GNAT superfamily N-acetyltransferase
MVYDGWVLSFSAGYTRRANSVDALYPSSIPFDEKIATCERQYVRVGTAPVFKVCSLAEPGLDAALERHGYAAQSETSVQVADLADPVADPAIELSADLDESWLDDFCALTHTPDRWRPTMGAMLRKIAPEHTFARQRHEGAPIALGMAVAERGWVGLYDIVVDQPWRNQGLGYRLVSSLLRWGQQSGATRAHLAVMGDNAPALALYARLGFGEVYRYWYRARA